MFLADKLHLSGESGRFVLPDKSVIDDPFEYTLDDYREWQMRINHSHQKALPSVMLINWIKQPETHKGANEDTGSGTYEIESGENQSKKNP